jgi:hypothetical protein
MRWLFLKKHPQLVVVYGFLLRQKTFDTLNICHTVLVGLG